MNGASCEGTYLSQLSANSALAAGSGTEIPSTATKHPLASDEIVQTVKLCEVVW